MLTVVSRPWVAVALSHAVFVIERQSWLKKTCRQPLISSRSPPLHFTVACACTSFLVAGLLYCGSSTRPGHGVRPTAADASPADGPTMNPITNSRPTLSTHSRPRRMVTSWNTRPGRKVINTTPDGAGHDHPFGP
jgi:hypothetical protein